MLTRSPAFRSPQVVGDAVDVAANHMAAELVADLD